MAERKSRGSSAKGAAPGASKAGAKRRRKPSAAVIDVGESGEARSKAPKDPEAEDRDAEAAGDADESAEESGDESADEPIDGVDVDLASAAPIEPDDVIDVPA